MRILSALFCLPLLLVFAGCASGPRYSPLVVQVVELKADDAGYALTFRYNNPNTQPLAILRSSQVLTLGGTTIGRIESKEPVGVPALGSSAQTLHLSADNAKAVRTFAASHAPATTYAFGGTVELSLLGDDLSDLKTYGHGHLTLGAGVVPAPTPAAQ